MNLGLSENEAGAVIGSVAEHILLVQVGVQRAQSLVIFHIP